MSNTPQLRPRRWVRVAAFALLMAGTLASNGGFQRRASRASAQPRNPELIMQEPFPEGMSRKQQQKLLKHNFEKMKEDAGELAALAKSLQEDIEKTTENMLSLEVVEKADKIEKLAKRIKNTAKGH